MSNYHTPVLVDEVIEGLKVQRGKKYIDATVGGGGHGVEIIKHGGILLGLDVDREAVEETRRIFNFQFPIFKEGRDWKIIQGNFRDIERIARENGFEQVDGVLFDLGVSSHQLDTPERGFSYRFTDASLDLRLNQQEGESAATLLHRANREELYEIFASFGEEEHSRAIADAVVGARRLRPLATTGQLVAVIKKVAGGRQLTGVLARIFQALRIAVNDERNALKVGLEGAVRLLLPGGRLVVISFHSLEDRAVKNFFRSSDVRIVTKSPIRSNIEEVVKNSRARSAKLRIAEKL